MSTENRSRRPALRRAADLLWITLLLLTAAAHAEGLQQLHLSLTGIAADPQETISAIYLKVTGGLVVSLQRVPIGWTVTIDNDPSWNAQIRAVAIVGAANLAPDELRSDLLVIQRIPASLQKYPGAAQETSASGYVELYKPDRSRRIELSSRNFVLTR